MIFMFHFMNLWSKIKGIVFFTIATNVFKIIAGITAKWNDVDKLLKIISTITFTFFIWCSFVYLFCHQCNMSPESVIVIVARYFSIQLVYVHWMKPIPLQKSAHFSHHRQTGSTNQKKKGYENKIEHKRTIL